MKSINSTENHASGQTFIVGLLFACSQRPFAHNIDQCSVAFLAARRPSLDVSPQAA